VFQFAVSLGIRDLLLDISELGRLIGHAAAVVALVPRQWCTVQIGGVAKDGLVAVGIPSGCMGGCDDGVLVGAWAVGCLLNIRGLRIRVWGCFLFVPLLS